jgi:hypothetical protein
VNDIRRWKVSDTTVTRELFPERLIRDVSLMEDHSRRERKGPRYAVVVLVANAAPSFGIEPIAGETGHSSTSGEPAFSATQVVEDRCTSVGGLEDTNVVVPTLAVVGTLLLLSPESFSGDCFS